MTKEKNKEQKENIIETRKYNKRAKARKKREQK